MTSVEESRRKGTSVEVLSRRRTSRILDQFRRKRASVRRGPPKEVAQRIELARSLTVGAMRRTPEGRLVKVTEIDLSTGSIKVRFGKAGPVKRYPADKLQMP